MFSFRFFYSAFISSKNAPRYQPPRTGHVRSRIAACLTQGPFRKTLLPLLVSQCYHPHIHCVSILLVDQIARTLPYHFESVPSPLPRMGQTHRTCRLWQGPGEAEADPPAPVHRRRGAVGANRGTAELGVCTIASAPFHAARPRSRACRIRHRPRINLIPIQTPLPHVPVHVEQSPLVSHI